MRPVLLATLAILATVTVGSPAKAENEFEVIVEKGIIVVTAHEGWHINKEFPWKLIIGETKLDRSKFALEEHTAKLSGAPKGEGKLKGAVCSKDQCHTFEKEVSIR